MKPKLADLVAQMNESNRRPEIDFGPPVGREFAAMARTTRFRREHVRALRRITDGR